MDGKIYEFGDFVLDTSQQRLQKSGEDFPLAPKVFDVLVALVESHGQLVSYDELMEKVWQDTFVEETNLRYSIHLLRKTFDEDFIKTVPKRGYRFNADVQTFTTEEFIKKYADTNGNGKYTENGFVKLTEKSGKTSDLDFSQQQNFKPRKYSFLSANYFLSLTIFLVFVFLVFLAWWIYPRYFSQNSENNFQAKNHKLVYERITTSGRAFFVGLAPDNQNAVYVVLNAQNKYDIVLQNLPSKSETVIFKDNEVEPLSLNFSPDGNFLYFVTESKEKVRTVLRIPIYGGNTETVTHDAVSFFSVSPDGEWLAYFLNEPDKDSTHLAICRSSDGSGQKIISTLSGEKVFEIWGIQPAWSADSQKIAVILRNRGKDNVSVARKYELAEVNISDGKISTIKIPEWFSIGQPYWKKDGKGLFILAQEKAHTTFQIWHLAYPSGEAQNITNDTNNYREFRPSTDAGFIMTASIARSENLYVMSLDNQSDIRQLTFDSDIKNGYHGLKWTVDGQNLLYVRSNMSAAGDLWKINVENLEKQQLTFDSNALIGTVDVTPDGKSAIFASVKTGVVENLQIDIDGKNLRQIPNTKGGGMPEISPDGKWIYYVLPGDIPEALWKMPIDGNGEPIKILDGVHGPSIVSPTDPTKIVAFYFDKSETSKKPWKFILFKEGQPESLKTLDIFSMRRIDWKPDGSGIYYIENAESFNNIKFLSTENFQISQITNFKELKISNLSVSPDGKKMALTRGASIGNISKISGF